MKRSMLPAIDSVKHIQDNCHQAIEISIQNTEWHIAFLQVLQWTSNQMLSNTIGRR